MTGYYRPHNVKHLYVVEDGIAVEKISEGLAAGVRYPHRPDDVDPQKFRNYIRWWTARKREERER